MNQVINDCVMEYVWITDIDNGILDLSHCEQKMDEMPDDKLTIIDSYVKRDYICNKYGNVNDIFTKYLIKLGIFKTTDDEVTIMKKEFIKKIENLLMGTELLPNQTIYDMYEQFKREYSDQYEKTHQIKSERYNKIMDMIKQERTLYDLYNEFTIDELKYLGW